MKVTKSDLKKDVDMILDDLERDYEIPSFLYVFKVISKLIFGIVVVQLVVSALDFIIWSEKYSGGYTKPYDALLIYIMGILGVLIFPLFILFIVCYSPLTMMSCLSDRVKNSSLILTVARKRVRYISVSAVLVNVFVGACFAINESGMVVFMGGSWFVTIIVSAFIYNASMSPYLTPAVVSSLSKVKELLSASQK